MPETILDPERVLKIYLDGDAVSGGRIPLSTLANKMSALQATIFNLGAALSASGATAARGSWTDQIKQSCNLLFVASHAGSVELFTELKDNYVLPGMPDNGKETLAALPKVLTALNNRDEMALSRIMPDSTSRNRTLKSLQLFCPRPGEGLIIKLGDNSGYYGELTETTRQSISDYFLPRSRDNNYDYQTIIGDLVEIRVKSGTRHIVVLSMQREINCFYDAATMEQEISQLVAGSVIQVLGQVQLNVDGSVKQVDDIYDVTTIDLSPFMLRAFSWDGHQYPLREPVLCEIAFQNGLWIYECARYGLHSYSVDRIEALNQFHEEFAFLYDGLVTEPDDALTPDAVILKNKILQDLYRD